MKECGRNVRLSQINTRNPAPLQFDLCGSEEIYLARDRCRNRSGLNFHLPSFFGRIKQKLTAANINRSSPVAYVKDSLLAKACDRLILESQLTPGLYSGLHCCALADTIVHCSLTRCCIRWNHSNVLDDLGHLGFF